MYVYATVLIYLLIDLCIDIYMLNKMLYCPPAWFPNSTTSVVTTKPCYLVGAWGIPTYGGAVPPQEYSWAAEVAKIKTVHSMIIIVW